MSSGQTIKPCPFCGTTEHLYVGRVGSLTADMPDRPYRVACNHIDHDTVTGPVAYGREAACQAWNTRAHDADLLAALDREISALAWIKYQAESIMDLIGDPKAVMSNRSMVNSMASDIGVNAHMALDRIEAAIARARGEV